ncbi:MAG: hypothetical protein SFT94_05485 [Pseudanabaenaceae cyanobacterium bins.68]|nr:hypothetical protein [Pseudanabaenaceae cyanobacterium bins.68]
MKNLTAIIGATVGSLAASASFAGMASAAVLAPSTFNGTGTGGSVTAGALAAGTLNTTAPANGFGSFFSSDYVSVGATGGQTISASQDGGASVASSPITLSASDIAFGALNISFNYAFAGLGPVSGADSFTVALLNAAGTTNLGTFFTLSGSTGVTFSTNGTAGGSVNISALTPGSYNIGLIVSELSFDAGNSAAGFSNIDVTAVPFEFSPLGLVAVGGAYFFAKKNKKAKISA